MGRQARQLFLVMAVCLALCGNGLGETATLSGVADVSRTSQSLVQRFQNIGNYFNFLDFGLFFVDQVFPARTDFIFPTLPFLRTNPGLYFGKLKVCEKKDALSCLRYGGAALCCSSYSLALLILFFLGLTTRSSNWSRYMPPKTCLTWINDTYISFFPSCIGCVQCANTSVNILGHPCYTRKMGFMILSASSAVQAMLPMGYLRRSRAHGGQKGAPPYVDTAPTDDTSLVF
jgi:hypothetical protein